MRRIETPRETWLTWAARFGYAACGIVYLAIGFVAAAVAFGLAEEPTGSHGVMNALADQPFGPLALAALGIAGIDSWHLWRVRHAYRSKQGTRENR